MPRTDRSSHGRPTALQALPMWDPQEGYLELSRFDVFCWVRDFVNSGKRDQIADYSANQNAMHCSITHHENLAGELYNSDANANSSKVFT